MSHMQKATAAALALAITFVGATFVVAPMALADSPQVIARAHHWSASHLHRLASEPRPAASSSRAG
jgi:hypothetical protein